MKRLSTHRALYGRKSKVGRTTALCAEDSRDTPKYKIREGLYQVLSAKRTACRDYLTEPEHSGTGTKNVPRG